MPGQDGGVTYPVFGSGFAIEEPAEEGSVVYLGTLPDVGDHPEQGVVAVRGNENPGQITTTRVYVRAEHVPPGGEVTEPKTVYAYRVVDGQNHGWLNVHGTDRYHGFDPSATTTTDRLLSDRPLADIEREFGKTRPVVLPSKSDQDELRAAFATAGGKLVASLASALEPVHAEACESGDGSWGYAVRTLSPGRPGSWESEAFTSIVVYGSGLKIWPNGETGTKTVEEMRATGPDPECVDVAARDRMAAVLRRWVASDDSYVEVAENLAGLVSRFADDTYRAGGWKKIAAPGTLSPDDNNVSRRLLYSLTEHRGAQ